MKNKNISINDICTKLDGGKSAIKETQLMQCFPLNSILKAVGKNSIDIRRIAGNDMLHKSSIIYRKQTIKNHTI